MFSNVSRPFVGWGLSRRAVTATTTVIASDRGYIIDATSGTYDIALTAAATLGAGFSFGVYNSGSGTVTINPNGAETIRSPAGSAATLALSQGQGVLVMCDGTGFEVVANATIPTSGTNTGDVTLTAVGSSPNANGASLSGQALTLQPADATQPGVVSNTAQTIPGAKTFPANAAFGADVILSAAPALIRKDTKSSYINVAGGDVNGGAGGGQFLVIGNTFGSGLSGSVLIDHGTATGAQVYVRDGAGVQMVSISNVAPTSVSPTTGTLVILVGGVGIAADINAGGGITTGSTTLHSTSVALTNGAAAQVGTLTNAPTAGNPTKWVPINDNGTTRYIPAW